MKGERNAVGMDSLIAIFFYSFILHLIYSISKLIKAWINIEKRACKTKLQDKKKKKKKRVIDRNKE